MPRLSTVLTTVFAAVLATAATSAIRPTVASAAQAAPTQAAVPLRDVVAALPVAIELRDGYDRTKFKHWVDADRDGCNTRAEVLLAEAATAPATAAKCAITGGSWYSGYDDTYITNPRTSDIDHMVPLAEAWDSGAHSWTPQQRQAYANDLDEPRALIAVTATTNRSKADQDPRSGSPLTNPRSANTSPAGPSSKPARTSPSTPQKKPPSPPSPPNAPTSPSPSPQQFQAARIDPLYQPGPVNIAPS